MVEVREAARRKEVSGSTKETQPELQMAPNKRLRQQNEIIHTHSVSTEALFTLNSSVHDNKQSLTQFTF